MIVTYQLGAARLSVDFVLPGDGNRDVIREMLSEVIAALTTTQTPLDDGPTDHGGIELTARQRKQLADLLSGTDPLDGSTSDSPDTNVYAANGQSGGRVTDHLEVVDLDDDDAFPRIAFDAFMTATGATNNWEGRPNLTDRGWRAAAAAVRAATLLQQANRVVAGT